MNLTLSRRSSRGSPCSQISWSWEKCRLVCAGMAWSLIAACFVREWKPRMESPILTQGSMGLGWSM